MDPVYLDLHIHTSDNPKSLEENYDIDTLITKVKEIAEGDNFLISFTDHNTINEKAYLEAIKKIGSKIILGVELHIKAYKEEDTPAYHCHIYFDLEEINLETIQDLNSKLDDLYPNKTPTKKSKEIPVIETILDKFDTYSFILLPHGGQSLATFDSAIPKGKSFDNLMERSIYYNFFDGFTSRSEVGTEKTREYLKKLGVNEFVNLVTCTDNYSPSVYPRAKAKGAAEFVPTWMYATPNFSGLKLSLTDESRFEYKNKKPSKWKEFIKSIHLDGEKINIDVKLTPGLNVIIGESSSGKTLLVDSMMKFLEGNGFVESDYRQYGIEKIIVDFPDATIPHFISQNFIADIVKDNEKNIDEIEIIKNFFPKDVNAEKIISKGLEKLKSNIESLFDCIEKIEKIESSLKTIPVLSGLISIKQANKNILKEFLEVVTSLKNVDYNELDKDSDIEYLDSINKRLKENPFIDYDESLIDKLKAELIKIRKYSLIDEEIQEVVLNNKSEIDELLKERDGEEQDKKQKFEKLIELLKDYYQELNKFKYLLKEIVDYSIEPTEKKIKIGDYILSTENKFELTKIVFQEELNKFLLADKTISDVENIFPSDLFRKNFANNQKGSQEGTMPSYRYIKDNIYSKFSSRNKVNRKIKISDGRDFKELSPGLKTAVVLELIINFKGDDAPLIIDQPEDNLATSYINGALVKSIQNNRQKKQIIFVSHNATIPMAGDAQNIILCENNKGEINIKSAPLEGKINGKNVVDYVAEITDGGKSSVKKRFKKYDLKKFKENN